MDDSENELSDQEGGHHEQMRQMNQMFQDPFFNMGSSGLLGLPEPAGSGNRRHQRQQQQAQNMQVAERGRLMDPFAHFDSMFSNMRNMMSDMHRSFASVSSDPNAQVFQQSSVMSYSNTGNGGQPRVYQASTSTRQAPGGVRETRKTIRDSVKGVEKISVGHHINDRGHVIERSRHRDGQQHENQELINLDEEEAPEFDREYKEKWHSTMRGIDQRRHVERARHAPLGGEQHRRQRGLPEPERRQRKVSNKRE